jgi:hypothetical protein
LRSTDFQKGISSKKLIKKKNISIIVSDNLERKFVQLERTAGTLHGINDAKLRDIEGSNFIVKLYRYTFGEGDLSKVKHQRNLQVLNQFPNLKKEASIQINNVLLTLGIFQAEVESMKKTASGLGRVQTLSLDINVKTLEDAIDKLREYHQRFNQRLTKINRM